VRLIKGMALSAFKKPVSLKKGRAISAGHSFRDIKGAEVQ
jgi:hypothetical protein